MNKASLFILFRKQELYYTFKKGDGNGKRLFKIFY